MTPSQTMTFSLVLQWTGLCPLRPYRRRAFQASRLAGARKGGLCHPPLQSLALPAVWAYGFPRRHRVTTARHRRAPGAAMPDSASCLVACSPPPPRPERGEPDPVSQSVPDGTFQGLTGNPAVRKMHPGGAPSSGCRTRRRDGKGGTD